MTRTFLIGEKGHSGGEAGRRNPFSATKVQWALKPETAKRRKQKEKGASEKFDQHEKMGVGGRLKKVGSLKRNERVGGGGTRKGKEDGKGEKQGESGTTISLLPGIELANWERKKKRTTSF